MVLDWDKVSSNQSSIFKQMCRPLKKNNDEEEEKDEVQWCQSLHLDIAPKIVQRRRRSDVIHCQIMRGIVAYFSLSMGFTQQACIAPYTT